MTAILKEISLTRSSNGRWVCTLPMDLVKRMETDRWGLGSAFIVYDHGKIEIVRPENLATTMTGKSFEMEANTSQGMEIASDLMQVKKTESIMSLNKMTPGHGPSTIKRLATAKENEGSRSGGGKGTQRKKIAAGQI